ncbi:MAG TPA: hypothetical protein VH560_09870, partial [Polyangia bacterium]|nr:hypothetical protein [Polyangia bacterium]
PATLPPPARDPSGHARRVAAWSAGGVAVAALGVGVAFNLEARSKMNSCASQWNATMMGSALDLCDQAKPFAYGSYALFGVAGAAAAVSALFFLWQPSAQTAEEPAVTEVSLLPALGSGAGAGASLVASGRF